MRRSFSNLWKRTGIIGLSLLVLAGCSAMRLGYNQGPQLAHWWLDGYLDLNDEQSPRVREALSRWFTWHRQTQLPDYASLLAQTRSRLDDPVDATQVCQWNDQIRSRIEPVLDRALPLAAELVSTLTPAQIDYLEKRYAKDNQKLRKEHLQPDPAERLQGSVTRTVDRFESFYGSLDEAQRRLVADAMAASPFDARVWLTEREQRQRELLATLRQIATDRPDAARTLVMLRSVARRFDGSPQPATAAAQQRLTRYNCELTARLHQTTTPAQRRHARDKLKGWEDDVRHLAAGAPPAAAQAALGRDSVGQSAAHMFTAAAAP